MKGEGAVAPFNGSTIIITFHTRLRHLYTWLVSCTVRKIGQWSLKWKHRERKGEEKGKGRKGKRQETKGEERKQREKTER